MERKKMERKRIRDFGIVPGVMNTGPKNKITDVPGVLVGHKTVRSGDSRTGVTVIVPGPGNVFDRKFIAAGYVHNGFGKTCGLVQVEELGTLETPIALTNTLNVGLAADALVEYTIRQCAKEQVEEMCIRDRIRIGDRACREMGIENPRIAVAGLNPHSGEHGLRCV